LSEKGLAFLPILEHIKEWNLKYEVALIPKETDRVTYAG
jgi:DNA-binding HxlR family transcriptional regulator